MQDDQLYPQGDEVNLDHFFRKHRHELERFIGMRVGISSDVEDLAAEVIYQLLAYCQRSAERIVNHRALMYKIARNRIADYHANPRAQLTVSMDADEAPDVPSPRSLAGETMAREELMAALGALRGMRDEYREIIILRANVGLSITEIAEMMEKPQAHVRVLLFRARRALKRALRTSHPHAYGNEVDESKN